MARIRTIKPEAFASESLAAVPLTAERTFFGLLTQADDHGRFRDQPAVLAGLLWSLRPDHGPVGVEDDLAQLATQDLVCRYAGEDGKRYLSTSSPGTCTRRSTVPAVYATRPAPSTTARARRPPDSGALTEQAMKPPCPLTEDSRRVRSTCMSPQ
ncbi:hypothetical protein SLAV_05840 [Streptomyces lavendulae subsp. lavendulae]|uniref:Uncharacterized protein n=1 Tax=Streptomyces lavendulae subsp. lavendulae TaxID=58340 RepID=A0A2K8PBF7_STRLA|nr:hypothetical protein SLAV_05840 [Streptomyces lavendulae subsp. lavendulae]